MSKKQLRALRDQLETEVKRRKGLGDYSQEAGGLSALFSVCLAIINHLLEKK